MTPSNRIWSVCLLLLAFSLFPLGNSVAGEKEEEHWLMDKIIPAKQRIEFEVDVGSYNMVNCQSLLKGLRKPKCRGNCLKIKDEASKNWAATPLCGGVGGEFLKGKRTISIENSEEFDIPVRITLRKAVIKKMTGAELEREFEKRGFVKMPAPPRGSTRARP